MPKRTFAVHKCSEPVLRIRPPLRLSLVAGSRVTANEQFKGTFGPAFRAGLFVALSAHYLALTVFPSLEAAELPVAAGALTALELPPRVSVPAPPQPVARPARPVIADVVVAENLTIAPTTFDAFEPVAETALAPPQVVTVDDGRPPYIPFEVAPELQNKAETIALLQKVYPTALRDSGIGGSVKLWIYVDEKGVVRDCQIDVSSGFEALDLAAVTVAHGMEFSPAMMRDKAAAVWISQPIDFISK